MRPAAGWNMQLALRSSFALLTGMPPLRPGVCLQDRQVGPGSDPVLWHCFGVTHFVRPEDFPIMPMETTGFSERCREPESSICIGFALDTQSRHCVWRQCLCLVSNLQRTRLLANDVCKGVDVLLACSPEAYRFLQGKPFSGPALGIQQGQQAVRLQPSDSTSEWAWQWDEWSRQWPRQRARQWPREQARQWHWGGALSWRQVLGIGLCSATVDSLAWASVSVDRLPSPTLSYVSELSMKLSASFLHLMCCAPRVISILYYMS